MKKQGFAKWGIVIVVALVALAGVLSWHLATENARIDEFYKTYYATATTEGMNENGGIVDHVKGNLDTAEVVLFEYADFQCAHCAVMNPYVNQLVEDSDGKIAVVYRNYILSYNRNSTAAASAAEAAGLQGYWKPYMNKLFTEQSEWAYATSSERTLLFEKYFTEVTDGQGNTEKFLEDMASAEVSQKISFDVALAKRMGLEGTPSFYYEGQLIDFGNSKGGNVKVGDDTVYWEKSLSGDDFIQLINSILAVKIGTATGADRAP